MKNIIFRNRDQADTKIDFETTIQGNIEFTGSFFLEGKVNGNMSCKNFENTSLIVAPRGEVNGNITSKKVVIAGIVYGDIKANFLELQDTARVFGNIFYDSIKINPSVEVNGKFIPLREPLKISKVSLNNKSNKDQDSLIEFDDK